METELYAGKDLYGSGLYTGVYGMKITFNEVPEYYTRPADADADDDSYYRLDIGELIDEYNRRALYNVNFEEGELDFSYETGEAQTELPKEAQDEFSEKVQDELSKETQDAFPEEIQDEFSKEPVEEMAKTELV